MLLAAPVAMYVLDREGFVRMWNPAAERMFGWREHEVLGRPHPPVPAETQDDFLAILDQALRGESLVDRELRRQKKDGAPIDVALSTAPLRNAEGAIIGVVSFAADITDRRRAVEALRESATRYELLARTAPVGIFYTDADGNCLYVNERWREIAGLTPEEALGPGWVRGLHAGDRERVFAEWQDAARMGSPFVSEYRFHRPDGVTTWVLGQAVAHTSATGDVVSYVGTITDITERKTAEEQRMLQAAVARLLSEGRGLPNIAARLLEVICVAMNWNRGELWSFDTSDGAPKLSSAWEVSPAPTAGLGTAGLGPICAGAELSARVRDTGQPAWIDDIRVEASPVQSAAPRSGLGTVVGLPIQAGSQVSTVMVLLSLNARTLEARELAFLSEIAARVGDFLERDHAETALKESEAQVRRLQKLEAVGRLAGGIAHDFNNLLTVVSGRSQLLLGRLPPQDPLRRDVGLIDNAAARAAALTKQLLAFSRKQVLHPKVLDLNAPVSGTVTMLERVIGEHIDLIFRPAPNLGRVSADPGQLDQVVLNLVLNARDAMPSGGRLTIETVNVEIDARYARRHAEVEPGPYVMLAVTDTGIGMDTETQARIFEPFFTTKGPDGGTGLGLATVYGIVKQSGGHVWVYSEPGQGTSFKVYLPRVAGNPPAAAEAPIPNPARGTETVLVVEDEDEVRALTCEILRGYGYAVLEAQAPSEALAIAERYRGPIHLLLTDVVMPEMSGRVLGERLVRRRVEMTTVFMSGYADDAIIRHGTLKPGTPFLQKPFTPAALARRVREGLDAIYEQRDR